MSTVAIFFIGLSATVLCALFLFISIHEMRRLNPAPSAQERAAQEKE